MSFKEKRGMYAGITWFRHPLRVAPSLATVSACVLTLCVFASTDSAIADAIRKPYITGLNGPRGLIINADGHLVIAEGGTGVDDGRVLEASDLNSDGDAEDEGEITKVATGLPSFINNDDPEAPELAGVSGVAQAADGTYWIVVGGGLATGGGPMPPFSTLGRIVNGTYEVVADLGQYETDNDPDADGPDSNPYDLTFGADGYI
jgi:hypothetical protein